MVKHKPPYIHFLKNFWKTLSNIPVSYNCFLSLQLDGFDQSCTEENGIHYFFNCSLFFLPLLVWGHLQRPILNFFDVLEHQKKVSMFYHQL